MKCKECENYILSLDTCKFCSFKKTSLLKDFPWSEEGHIVNSWFGFDKFDETKEPYLGVEVKMNDGWSATLTFSIDQVSEILDFFIDDDKYHKTVSGLKGCYVLLYPHPSQASTMAPIGISSSRKNKWFFKRGWENGEEISKK